MTTSWRGEINNEPFRSHFILPLNCGSLSLFFSILVEADNHKDAFKTSELVFGLSCQMMAQQTEARGRSVAPEQSSETGLRLQQALEQIPAISAALCDIQRYYQEQVCVDDEREEKRPPTLVCLCVFSMSPVSF